MTLPHQARFCHERPWNGTEGRMDMAKITEEEAQYLLTLIDASERRL